MRIIGANLRTYNIRTFHAVFRLLCLKTTPRVSDWISYQARDPHVHQSFSPKQNPLEASEAKRIDRIACQQVVRNCNCSAFHCFNKKIYKISAISN